MLFIPLLYNSLFFPAKNNATRKAWIWSILISLVLLLIHVLVAEGAAKKWRGSRRGFELTRRSARK